MKAMIHAIRKGRKRTTERGREGERLRGRERGERARY
jgi:hypothetical protein